MNLQVASTDAVARPRGGTDWLAQADQHEQVLRDLLGPKALFASPASRMRRAGYLAELGWKAIDEQPQILRQCRAGDANRLNRWRTA